MILNKVLLFGMGIKTIRPLTVKSRCTMTSTLVVHNLTDTTVVTIVVGTNFFHRFFTLLSPESLGTATSVEGRYINKSLPILITLGKFRWL